MDGQSHTFFSFFAFKDASERKPTEPPWSGHQEQHPRGFLWKEEEACAVEQPAGHPCRHNISTSHSHPQWAKESCKSGSGQWVAAVEVSCFSHSACIKPLNEIDESSVFSFLKKSYFIST